MRPAEALQRAVQTAPAGRWPRFTGPKTRLACRCLQRPTARWTLHSLLQACRDEIVEIAVEHGLRVADLVIRPQVLDPRLVEHVAANLVTPADVGLRVLQLLLLGLALAQL